MSLWTTLARLAERPWDEHACVELDRELRRLAERSRLRLDVVDDAVGNLRVRFGDTAQKILNSVCAQHAELAEAGLDDAAAVVRGDVESAILKKATSQLERYATRSLHNQRRDIDRKRRIEEKRARELGERTRQQGERQRADEAARRAIDAALDVLGEWVRQTHLFGDAQVPPAALFHEVRALAFGETTMANLVAGLVSPTSSDLAEESERVRAALYKRHQRFREALLDIADLKERQGKIDAASAMQVRAVVSGFLRRRRAGQIPEGPRVPRTEHE